MHSHHGHDGGIFIDPETGLRSYRRRSSGQQSRKSSIGGDQKSSSSRPPTTATANKDNGDDDKDNQDKDSEITIKEKDANEVSVTKRSEDGEVDSENAEEVLPGLISNGIHPVGGVSGPHNKNDVGESTQTSKGGRTVRLPQVKKYNKSSRTFLELILF